MKRKVINSLLLVFCTHNFKFILLLTQIQKAKYQKVGECHVQEYLAETLKLHIIHSIGTLNHLFDVIFL